VLLRFEEFELDEARFELRRRGRPVPVQPKVLDLLLFLARQRERVVSKDELLDSVWPGVTVSEASLSQAVSLARKALGDGPEAQRCIRTVRGRGFQFVARPAAGDPGPPTPEGGPGRWREATSVSLQLGGETASRGEEAVGGTVRPHLFAALHCDDVALGGARYDLSAVDEVEIGRGPERAATRVTDAITRRLELRIPGEAASRRHARLVRAQQSFVLVDAGSKNGTFVGGQRVESHVLADGDVFECGRTYFLYARLPTPDDLQADVDGGELGDEPDSLVPNQQQLRHVVGRIAGTRMPILLHGEAGAGKEAAARGFHARSRRPGPFISVKGGALAAGSALLQLFGLGGGVRGADDEGDRPSGRLGLVRRAQGGTLFIDQVDALPDDAQAALVLLLDHGLVMPVGSTEPVPVDVRVMTATSGDLPALVTEGRFRADLHSRLAAFPHRVPPLRERRGDIGLLAARALAGRGARLAVSPQAGQALLAHLWPANLRELAQTLEAALALSGGGPVTAAHLPSTLVGALEARR
jgi:DNA-binding winged helix-turn-helix (wHTH) protein